MKPTFILLHTECVNQCRDSVCHIILVPVVNGRRDDTIEYIVNPHATFDFVMSGITEEQLAAAPGLEQEWTDIQCLLETSGDIVCSAEGYSARALSGTLARLGIKAPKYAFCNAKAICRRSMSEPSYSLDYLSGVRFGDYVAETDPVAIAERWADLVIAGLDPRDEADIPSFLAVAKIRPGYISPDDYAPSECVRLSHNRPLDLSGVEVVAPDTHPLHGLNVVFTGKLESMTRAEARTLVTACGGEAPDTLTKSTDLLVVGAQVLRVVGASGLSGKMKKAAKFKESGSDIEIITEADFLELVQSV